MLIRVCICLAIEDACPLPLLLSRTGVSRRSYVIGVVRDTGSNWRRDGVGRRADLTMLCCRDCRIIRSYCCLISCCEWWSNRPR